MQKLYLNTVDRTWYDADGSQPSDSNPQIPLGNTERIVIQCCTETPDAGTPGVDPETNWTKDTQFDLPGVSALLSADNNFTRHLKGKLASALDAGTVSSAVLTVSNPTTGKIPSAGSVRLFDASGGFETLEYTARSVSGSAVTFTLASGSVLENSYAAGADADCPESLYAQAAMNTDESDPATGLFVFDIVMDSRKLRENSDYADTSEIGDVKGLELLIFTVQGSTVETRNSYLCTTFRIPIPMADPNQNPSMPETYEDNVAAIINALLAQGFSVQFSADGANWHDTQTASDTMFRFRSVSSGASGAWSSAVAMARGPKGDNAYVYVAYAVDSIGTDFSLTPTNSLKYRAEIHPDHAIDAPTAADFADAVWVKYIGNDGQGTGDMLKAVYDPDDDGSVSEADHAETADAVPWSGVNGKPPSFTPSSHTHPPADLTDKARQTVWTTSSPSYLPMNVNVIVNSSTVSGTTLNIAFTSVKNSSGGSYTGVAGDQFTWEYHVTCSAGILTINLGERMIPVDMPDDLDLVNAAPTTHVFTVRAAYKNGSGTDNLRFFISYAYSFEA